MAGRRNTLRRAHRCCTDYEGRYDDGHHRRSYIAAGQGPYTMVNLADEAPLESALSSTASGQDRRFTTANSPGFLCWRAHTWNSFVTAKDAFTPYASIGSYHSALRRQRGLPRLGLKTQFVLYLFAKF